MNSDLAGYYPKWLGEELLWSDFPWERGVTTTFPEFLRRYTLHDSDWIALHFDPGESVSAVLVLRWDTFWSDGKIPHPGSLVAEWPILLVRIRTVRSVRFDRFEEDLRPRTIAAAESLLVDSLHLTEIEDTFSGSVLIEHEPEITLLCLSPARDVLPIPYEGERC